LFLGCSPPLFLLFGATAHAADDRDFTSSWDGYAIKFVGVERARRRGVERERADAARSRRRLKKVKFSGADKGCTWNIKVTWATTTARRSSAASISARSTP